MAGEERRNKPTERNIYGLRTIAFFGDGAELYDLVKGKTTLPEFMERNKGRVLLFQGRDVKVSEVVAIVIE